MICVILPTRGMVFTEVEHAIELERQKHELFVLRSFNLPIPYGHNELVKEALTNKYVTHLWMLEEDTVPPVDALQSMLEQQSPITCIDYGVGGWSCITREKETKEILYCGMGCTLIQRDVFDLLPYPWFRSDKAFRIDLQKWVDVNDQQQYGLQDIWFCWKAREAGLKIKQTPGECKHLMLKALGKKEINNGIHIIEEKPRIEKHNEMSYF